MLYRIFLIFGVLVFASNISAKNTIIDCQLESHSVCQARSIKIIGEQWNDTTLKHCHISGGSTGVTIEGVANFRLDSCTIENIKKGSGIYISSDKPSSNIVLVNNTLRNIAKNGIAAPENSVSGLIIEQNTLENIATHKRQGLHHGLYVQVPGALIQDNTIKQVQDGNGIAIRSSSTIKNNSIVGTGKSGIGYYNDHPAPLESTLFIMGNVISDYGQQFSNRSGIELLLTSKKYTPIFKVIISNNRVSGVNPITCGGHANCLVD